MNILLRFWRAGAVICAACTSLLLAQRAQAANDIAGSPILFNDNGAWSWFEDERAIVDATAGKIVVSSVADSSGTGGLARNGDVDVVSYDLNSQAIHRFTLSENLEDDDHDSAALLTLPDGRYLASYSRHSTDKLVRWRVSSRAGDATAWQSEQTFTVNPASTGGTTYSNLIHLSASNDVFNFHREAGASGGFDPHYLKWDLDAQSAFAYGGRLLTGPEGNVGNNDRPYLRYTSNGVDRIDFIATDAHPRNLLSNSVYHGYIQHEGGDDYGVYRSNGSRLGSLSEVGTSPFKASDFTRLLTGNAVSPANGLLMTRGWTTDVELDAAGNPYAVFTARVNDDPNDHRFFYARYATTGGWAVHELAKAGAGLYTQENDYTGLVALDPHDPNRLFMSSAIDPRTDEPLEHHEIFAGVTANGGDSWSWSPITFNSTMDNLRPIVPKWDDDHTALLWMRGTYTTYTDYDLDIVGLTEITPIEVLDLADLNRDGEVDEDDALAYLQGLHADLSGLTAAQARAQGDVNGDFLNNYEDFRLFRQAYDTAQGMGAMVDLLAVPEPGWTTLYGIAIAVFLVRRWSVSGTAGYR